MNHNLLNRLTFYILSAFLGIFYTLNAVEPLSLKDRPREEILSLTDFPYDSLKYTENRIFFVTSPRSGTHWTLYILKHFTKRPSSHGNQYHNIFHQVEDYCLPFIHHEHFGKRFRDGPSNYSFASPTENDKLLVIIRNPLDTVLRASTPFEDVYTVLVASPSFEDALDIAQNPADSYFQLKRNFNLFSNLLYYETWPEDSRYIIYYEDLLDNPREEIRKLLHFVEASNEGLDDFIVTIEQHEKQTIAQYHEIMSSVTKGKDRNIYQRQYSKEQLQTLISIFQEINPIIWDKYLKRYEL